MRRAFTAATSAAVAASLLGASTARPASDQASTAAAKRVTIRNFKFAPARIVVSRGTTIVWTNRDSADHTVVSKKGRWASRTLGTGARFSRTLRRAGTYPYICSIHPFMHGTVVVR